MTESVSDQASPSSLAQMAREAAAKSTNPQEAESLLRSAEQIEDTVRQLRESDASMVQALERFKAEMEALRTRDHLPIWVVILVLASFIAFLALVAVKHHV